MDEQDRINALFRRRLDHLEARDRNGGADMLSVDRTHVWRTAVMAAVLLVLVYDNLEGRSFRAQTMEFQQRMVAGLADLGQRIASVEAQTRTHAETLRDLRFGPLREPRPAADQPQDARPRVP